MTGLDDFDLGILFAAHRNALLAALDLRPVTFEARILCASVEVLDIKVVNVDERMRHAPRDVGGVTVMRKSRYARHRQTDNVELITGKMRLRIHVGHFQNPVWVSREQRTAGCGAVRGESPVIAAAGEFRLLLITAVTDQCLESRFQIAERGKITGPFFARWNAKQVVTPSSKRSFETSATPTIGSAAARQSFHHTEPIRNPI